MNIRAKIYGDWVEEPLLKAKKPKGAKADELDSIAVARESRWSQPVTSTSSLSQSLGSRRKCQSRA